MMRTLKTVLYLLLSLVCFGILIFSSFFLLRAIPKAPDKPPEILHTDGLFQQEGETVLPAEEEPPLAEAEELPQSAAEPSSEEPAAEDSVPKTKAEQYLQTMTPEEKIWQLFITTPEAITGVAAATRAGDMTKKALEQYPVGGLCYFAKNLEDQQQVTELLQKTQSYAKTPLFLCIDEEGGSVSRAGINEKLAVTHFPAAAEYGKAGDISAVYAMGRTLAEELGQLGFHVNFAPVADLANPANTEIGDRAYSSDPAAAAQMVTAMVKGLQRNGMLACLKHFPGHGSAEGDSHLGTATSIRTPEQMAQKEWLPFRSGIEEGAVFVMLSHMTNPNLSELPASLSPETVGYLREELGFHGLILTDSHEMQAITDHYTCSEAAVLALEAGVDMILMPADPKEAAEGVLTALESSRLSWEQIDSSVLRILTVKYAFGIMK